jgi:hypothetical protein
MLLEAHQTKEGLFLLRKNKKDVNYHVLTICHKHHIFNYEVKVKVITDFYLLTLTILKNAEYYRKQLLPAIIVYMELEFLNTCL